MSSVERCNLPDDALLARYRSDGAYTDCYATDLGTPVSQKEYIIAFYTTWLFGLERAILKWAVSKPSTDAEARSMAEGQSNTFAAWHVEDRRENQLLLSDYRGSTRSWLMSEPRTVGGARGTRLYFGSAVVPRRSASSGEARMGPVFSALLGFHKLYSVALLRAAKSRLAP